jgi:aminopeptidase N
MLAPVTKTPVAVFTPRGRAEQGAFALDVAARALDLIVEMFGVP